MTVFFDKARGHWRYNFTRDGQRYSQYCLELDGSPCQTKNAAKRAEERKKAEIQSDRPAPVVVGMPTLAIAMAAFDAQLPNSRFGRDRRNQVDELLEFFGEETPIAEIEARLPAYITWARQQPVRVYLGGGRKKTRRRNGPLWGDTQRTRSDSTINRYLDALRRAIGDFGRLPDPATGLPRLPWVPRIPALKEVERMPRPIPIADLDAILAAAPAHVVDAANLVRHMGFRKTEVMTLAVSQVDEERRGVWLRGENTKGRRDEFVPANKVAMEILLRRKAGARALGLKRLLWYQPRAAKDAVMIPKPRPVADLKRAWATAQRNAGLADRYRFHDIKATFVTSVALVASHSTTQKLARHRSFDTTQRYLKVVDQVSRDAVDAIARTSRPAPTRTRNSHTGKATKRQGAKKGP